MSGVTVLRVDHVMTRLTIATGIGFEDFRAAMEQAVPTFDPTTYMNIVRASGTWTAVEAEVAASAPYGLLRYAVIEATPLMELAGHTGHAVEYLIGNHVIAETMYRLDRAALLYAPLRVLLLSDDADDAVFAIDQPSTVFAGLDDPGTAATGVLLDRKVASMLRGIGVAISDDLTPSDG